MPGGTESALLSLFPLVYSTSSQKNKQSVIARPTSTPRTLSIFFCLFAFIFESYIYLGHSMIFVKGPDKEPMSASIDQEPLVSEKERLHHPPTVRKPSSFWSYAGKAGSQSLACDCGGREPLRKVDDIQACAIAVVFGLAVYNVVPEKYAGYLQVMFWVVFILVYFAPQVVAAWLVVHTMLLASSRDRFPFHDCRVGPDGCSSIGIRGCALSECLA